MSFSRRTFLQRGSLLAAGTAAWPEWMPRLVFRNNQTAAKGDVLVVIFGRGGYDGLNMVSPLQDFGRYREMRPTIFIPAPDDTGAPSNLRSIDLDGNFGLHPALGLADMGRWKEHFDNGILGVVHAVGMDDATRSHFDAQDFMERGTPGEKKLSTGWLGRHLTSMRSQNNSPFRAVGMGTMLQAALRGPVPAVTLQSIADFHLQGDTREVARFQQQLAQLYSGEGWLDEQGQSTFAALDMLSDKIGSGAYMPSNGAKYGNNGFHQGMMQIAQLVKADVGLEVACIDVGGWDTHANQVTPGATAQGGMANNMLQLAQGITAFVTDLQDNFDAREKGKQGVTVVVMSEFGRRATENGGYGTDHGHGNVMYLLGRGINGGKVHANWPTLAADKLDRGDLAATTEYRDVLAEVLQKRCGNEAVTEVFPGHTFNFVGVATPLDTTTPPTAVPQPTAAPTDVPPKPTDGVPGPENKVYLPLGYKG